MVLQANNDITVTDAIAVTNNGVGIAMQAGRDINVNASVSTNNGNISMTANDSSAIGANRANATTGDITFGGRGKPQRRRWEYQPDCRAFIHRAI